MTPDDAVESIKSRATWDEQMDGDGDWVLAPLNAVDGADALLQPRPKCAWGDGPRPLCEYSRMAAATSEYNNPRYKHENILTLELDPPERTTQVSSFAGSSRWLWFPS